MTPNELQDLTWAIEAAITDAEHRLSMLALADYLARLEAAQHAMTKRITALEQLHAGARTLAQLIAEGSIQLIAAEGGPHDERRGMAGRERDARGAGDRHDAPSANGETAR